MSRTLIVTAIILSLVLTSFPVGQGGEGVGNDVFPLLNDPVQPPDGGTVYVNSTWNITDLREYRNCTIILTGNLTIESGGSLTLKNVTLRMNSTDSVEYFIEVLNGGTLHVLDLDNDNYTPNDASKILRNNESYTYFFRAYEGSTLEIRNSVIQGCGRFSGLLENEGLYIRTDNAVIDHNNFSYNYDGLVLYNSDAVVSNNTFYWNEVGITATTYSNATIENNWIGWSNGYGIEIDGHDNTDGPWPSNPIVRNNVIYKTGRDANTAVPVQIMFSCRPIITNLTLLDWTEDGIYIGLNSQPIINNTYMELDGGNFGIVSASIRTTNISNTTIIGTAGYYHLDIPEGALRVTNSTFNRTSVDIDTDSNLTVRNYLHIYINDSTGHPIPNATVHITDNANGTYDKNFTTDENGYVKWIALTDYWQNRSTTINYSDYKVSVSYPGVSFTDNNRSVRMNISRTEVFTAEPVPRTATATGPTNSAPSNINSVTITYTNSTNTSSVGLYYTADNGTTWTFIGNDTTIDGSYGWTIPADGVYGWMAVGDDESAPVGGEKPEAFSYTYDGTPPEIIGTAPLNGAVNVSVTLPIIINFSEPIKTTTFNFTCEPDPGGWSESWNATDSQVTLGHADFAVNRTYWINVTSANDRAGNALAGIYSFHFTTEVPDTTAPSITIISPADNAVFNSSSVTVVWSGSDNGSGIDHYEVRIDSGAWENVSTNTSYDFTALLDGSHTVDITAFDRAGNNNTDSVIFTVDTTAPEVTIDSPSDGAILNTTTVTVSWSGSDATSGIDHYNYRIDSGAWSANTTETGHTFSALSEGSHTVEVMATDGAGNTNATTVTFTIDTTAPTITQHSPTGQNVSVDSTINLTFSEPMNRASVQITVSGLSGTISWNGSTAVFTPAANLSEGTTYFVNVTGTDTAGNHLIPYTWNFTTAEAEHEVINPPAESTTGNISGVVVDESGDPVAGATVAVQGTNITAITDSTGHFILKNLSAGPHNLTISREGFNDTTSSVTVTEGETATVNPVLHPMASSPGNSPSTNSLLWWIILVVVAVLIAVGLLMRKKGGKEPLSSEETANQGPEDTDMEEPEEITKPAKPEAPSSSPPPAPENTQVQKPKFSREEMVANIEKAYREGKMSEEMYRRNMEKFGKL